MPRRMVRICHAYAAGESFIVMASAIRTMTGFGLRAGEDERDHDHDEHGEVGVVLHVNEPMAEVREV